ncbi:MAG: S-methyl-5'-thioadenosine phosphorylase, partial [Hyphomicrobiales bacterium]|nr:S-methyl-5'-thioadenosine phosphorylase [Hyphomicrobiales bacterium]
MNAILGVIGGSGVYDLPGLEGVRDETTASPWGTPSGPLRRGRIGATEVVFLARHGAGHRLSPSDVDYRANLDALKRAGVTHLVALSACGSFREDLAPGLCVTPDQYVDRTHRRPSSFFGAGCVAHVAFAEPTSPLLRARLNAAAAAEGVACRDGGTYLCIEGPQFSTRAESLAARAQGFDLVGMTAMPEAKLAREAEIPYATLALVTDYDCWHDGHAAVDVAAVVATLRANAANAARVIARLARDFPADPPPCPSGAETALDGAVMTAPSARDPALLGRLD